MYENAVFNMSIVQLTTTIRTGMSSTKASKNVAMTIPVDAMLKIKETPKRSKAKLPTTAPASCVNALKRKAMTERIVSMLPAVLKTVLKTSIYKLCINASVDQFNILVSQFPLFSIFYFISHTFPNINIFHI